jgi:hypothetical protein
VVTWFVVGRSGNVGILKHQSMRLPKINLEVISNKAIKLMVGEEKILLIELVKSESKSFVVTRDLSGSNWLLDFSI